MKEGFHVQYKPITLTHRNAELSHCAHGLKIAKMVIGCRCHPSSDGRGSATSEPSVRHRGLKEQNAEHASNLPPKKTSEEYRVTKLLFVPACYTRVECLVFERCSLVQTCSLEESSPTIT